MGKGEKVGGGESMNSQYLQPNINNDTKQIFESFAKVVNQQYKKHVENRLC